MTSSKSRNDRLTRKHRASGALLLCFSLVFAQSCGSFKLGGNPKDGAKSTSEDVAWTIKNMPSPPPPPPEEEERILESILSASISQSPSPSPSVEPSTSAVPSPVADPSPSPTPLPPLTAPVSAASSAPLAAIPEASPAAQSREPAQAKKKQKPGKLGFYRVKRGDTLMKIAFNTYGDLHRWRDIYEKNKDRIGKFASLAPGTELTLDGAEYVVIQKNGEPYLIRKKDTLIRISGKLYGTPRKWKALWDNNRQLIHNPNRIYSGFTLYYRPESQRKLASTPPPAAPSAPSPAPSPAPQPRSAEGAWK